MPNSAYARRACAFLLFLILLPSCAFPQPSPASGQETPASPQTAPGPEPQKSPELTAAECNCGVYALHATAHLLGSKVSLPDVANIVSSKGRGFTLQALKEASATLGYQAYAVRLTPEDLVALKWPAVLCTNRQFAAPHSGHFVSVLGKRNDGNLVIYSPADFISSYDIADFSESWDGEALVVATRPLTVEECFPYTSAKLPAGRSAPNAPLVLLGVLLALVGAYVVLAAFRLRRKATYGVTQ